MVSKTISFLPITYISGAFVGSQKNWGTFMKETYAINMAFKKFSCDFYDAKDT